jgi:hypothetical protein
MTDDSEATTPTAIVVAVEAPHIDTRPPGYYLWAEQFHRYGQEARAVECEGFTPVPYSMFCRALELVLKAFLLTKGRTIEHLKNVHHHNLQTLLDEAIEAGLTALVIVPPDWKSTVVRANVYNTNRDFEYYSFWTVLDWQKNRLPSLDTLDKMCSTLLEKLKDTCFQ